MLMELLVLYSFFFLMAQKSDHNLSCDIIALFTTFLRIELSCESHDLVTANKEMSDMFVVCLLALQS